jgi:hypothetical protein
MPGMGGPARAEWTIDRREWSICQNSFVGASGKASLGFQNTYHGTNAIIPAGQ